MTFQVTPDSVGKYGTLINRNGVHLSLVNVHLASHMKLGSTVGKLMNEVVDLVGTHQAAIDRMSDSLYRGFNALEASGRVLGRTADFYHSHDQQSAARLDSTYPASPRPAVDSPDSYRPPRLEGKAGPFAGGPGVDVQDPGAFLKPPGQPHDFTDPVKLFNVFSDLISPSWWLNEVIKDTIGVNPLKVVTDFFIGDWEGFARCAMVWDDLSRATGAIGDNVKSGLTWLAADWQGNAADAAVHYFDYTRQALESHRDVLHQLHEKYLDLARGVWNCARATADLLKLLLDKLIVAGAAVLAGWLTSWTGVGPSVSAAVAIYEIRDIMKLYDEMGGWMGKAHTAVVAFVGWLQSKEADTLTDIQAVPMPAIDYDHPDATPEKTGPRMKGETL